MQSDLGILIFIYPSKYCKLSDTTFIDFMENPNEWKNFACKS